MLNHLKYEREDKGFPQGMPNTWEYRYRYNAMGERVTARENWQVRSKAQN
ncbi:MAG: hypothetical protein J4G05_09765 [Chlorobi bacterium]|nr:hypothetical protein [Chlorobiota bacterium]